MNLLLDTHALLWALHAPNRLTPKARKAIEDPNNTIFYSAGAVWEIALKKAKGKLALPTGWLQAATSTGFHELPISAVDTIITAELPPHHRDPFDRLFIAQASTRRWHLVTRDPIIRSYDIDIIEA